MCHTVVTLLLHHSHVMHSDVQGSRTYLDRQLRRQFQIKKKEQLGLAIGTATYRLRKLVVFRLVQEAGKDLCYRCSFKIESANDLVFDHKVPWLDNSPHLFWDVENVAFSHAHCNRKFIRRGRNAEALRRVGPEGTAWCGRHQAFLPVEKFRRNRSHWNGLSFSCKACESRSFKLRVGRWSGTLF